MSSAKISLEASFRASFSFFIQASFNWSIIQMETRRFRICIELRSPWMRLGSTWKCLGSTWKHLGSSWKSLGSSWMLLGSSWKRLGSSWMLLGTDAAAVIESLLTLRSLDCISNKWFTFACKSSIILSTWDTLEESKTLDSWMVLEELLAMPWMVLSLVCMCFTLPKTSACPAAYCSRTSLMSYGLKAVLKFLRAMKYLTVRINRIAFFSWFVSA